MENKICTVRLNSGVILGTAFLIGLGASLGKHVGNEIVFVHIPNLRSKFVKKWKEKNGTPETSEGEDKQES